VTTERVKGRDFVLDVAERPRPTALVLLSLQHLFAMFGATVLVPLLTGLDPSVALISSGLGTLLFLAITQFKVPSYLGSSFAFIGPIIAATTMGGAAGAMVGCVAAGLVYVLVALAIRSFGVGWLLRLLPPIVVGPVIVVIGLGLSTIAVQMANGTVAGGPYSLPHFLVALFTLGAIIVFAAVLRGFVTAVPILLGVAAGYLLAALVGMVDFTPFLDATFFAPPNFVLLFDGLPEAAPVAAIVLLVAPVALVTLAEHIGHLVVLGRIVDRPYLEDPGLVRTLSGDGLATALAGLLGGPPNTTYGENIGVLAITRNFSVWPIAGAALVAILLGFSDALAAFLATIPTAVMGGVCIALFGVIAAAGLRTLVEAKVDFGDRRNLLIASSILVLGIGGATLQFGQEEAKGGFVVSSMARAAVAGALLYTVLPKRSPD